MAASPVALPPSFVMAPCHRPADRGSACRGGGAGGFTLAELLAALAIAALLLVMASATIGTWIPRYQQRNAAQALAGALQLARGEALRRNERVDLCASVDHVTCDGAARWQAGWIVFVD